MKNSQDNPTHVVNSYGIDPEKAVELDRDRIIPLTSEVAECFCAEANKAFAKEETRALLVNGTAQVLVDSISKNRDFPFTAQLKDGVIVLTPDLSKKENPVLKDLSDGFTSVYKELVRTRECSELFKFALTTLLQPALHAAYCYAGMQVGPHTKYTLRSC